MPYHLKTCPFKRFPGEKISHITIRAVLQGGLLLSMWKQRSLRGRFGFQKNTSKNHGFAGNERQGQYETIKKGCHDYGDSVKSARNQRFITWKIQISAASWAISRLVQCLACQGGCKCILQLCILVVFTLILWTWGALFILLLLHNLYLCEITDY